MPPPSPVAAPAVPLPGAFVAGRATVAFPAVGASAAADAAATRDGDAALAGFAVPVAAADLPASAVGAVNAAKPGVAAECPNAGR
jgi:hypothetical protein